MNNRSICNSSLWAEANYLENKTSYIFYESKCDARDTEGSLYRAVERKTSLNFSLLSCFLPIHPSIRSYAFTGIKFSLVSTDGKTIGLNTLSMIAKLYVVTYILLKSQKSAILSLSMLEFPANEINDGTPLGAARRGGGSCYSPRIKRRKSAQGRREDTQTPENPLVDGHDTPQRRARRRIRDAEKCRGDGQGK